jgi:hypothetical protein
VVQAEEILRRLRTRPFQPFRVVLKGNKSFEITSHENNLILRTCFDIGIPVPGMEDPVADHFETVSLDQIDRLEGLETGLRSTSVVK